MIDLHTHSCFSDGTDTPAQLIDKAVGLGLKAVALTDHNTLGGIPEFLDAAAGKDITAVPGIEIATDYEGRELHMVGLFIPESAHEEINRMLQTVMEQKLQNTKDTIRRLSQAGYDISFEEVRKKAAGSINRVHLATVLMEKGYISSIGEAFSGLLRENGDFYHPSPRLDVFEVIETMCRLQIVPVLAHSFLNLNAQELREFLTKAVGHGLRAMEVAYATYDADTMALARQIADEFHLLYSGGSDYHGTKKPNLLGRGCNDMSVPDEWLDALYKSSGSSSRASSSASR